MAHARSHLGLDGMFMLVGEFWHLCRTMAWKIGAKIQPAYFVTLSEAAVLPYVDSKRGLGHCWISVNLNGEAAG